MLKVYFAGSIRGGRQDATLYHRLITHISSLPDTVVLTEQVGDLNRSLQEQGRTRDAAIYAQDTAWLRACDLVIAECTHPSLGVGYELAYAEKLGKPVYIFYRHQETELSAMLTGDSYFHIASYEKEEELTAMIDALLQKR